MFIVFCSTFKVTQFLYCICILFQLTFWLFQTSDSSLRPAPSAAHWGSTSRTGSREPRSRRSSWTASRRSSGRSSTCPSLSGLSFLLNSNSQKHKWALHWFSVHVFVFLLVFCIAMRSSSPQGHLFDVILSGENLVPEQTSENETSPGVGAWEAALCHSSYVAAAFWDPSLPSPFTPGQLSTPSHVPGFPDQP